MAHFVNPLIGNHFVDANILNDIADDQNEAARQLMALSDSVEVNLLLPYSVQKEIDHPNTPDHVKRVAKLFLFSKEVTLTAPEIEHYARLVTEAKGNSEVKNVAADLFHAWEAAKYGAGYFVTRDKKFLNRADAIWRVVQVKVVTPSEFLERVQEARARDQKFKAQLSS
jgi:predicted nucleic acid-binding protein